MNKSPSQERGKKQSKPAQNIYKHGTRTYEETLQTVKELSVLMKEQKHNTTPGGEGGNQAEVLKSIGDTINAHVVRKPPYYTGTPTTTSTGTYFPPQKDTEEWEKVHPILQGCDDDYVEIWNEKGLDWKTLKRAEEYHDKVITKIDKKLKGFLAKQREEYDKLFEKVISKSPAFNSPYYAGYHRCLDVIKQLRTKGEKGEGK